MLKAFTTFLESNLNMLNQKLRISIGIGIFFVNALALVSKISQIFKHKWFVYRNSLLSIESNQFVHVIQ